MGGRMIIPQPTALIVFVSFVCFVVKRTIPPSTAADTRWLTFPTRRTFAWPCRAIVWPSRASHCYRDSCHTIPTDLPWQPRLLVARAAALDLQVQGTEDNQRKNQRHTGCRVGHRQSLLSTSRAATPAAAFTIARTIASATGLVSTARHSAGETR